MRNSLEARRVRDEPDMPVRVEINGNSVTIDFADFVKILDGADWSAEDSDSVNAALGDLRELSGYSSL